MQDARAAREAEFTALWSTAADSALVAGECSSFKLRGLHGG